VIVLLESDGIQFWCSSPVVTRMLVEKGARIVGAGAKAENLAHLVNRSDTGRRPCAGGAADGADHPGREGTSWRPCTQPQSETSSPAWLYDLIEIPIGRRWWP
jgi:hypothetical protein